MIWLVIECTIIHTHRISGGNQKIRAISLDIKPRTLTFKSNIEVEKVNFLTRIVLFKWSRLGNLLIYLWLSTQSFTHTVFRVAIGKSAISLESKSEFSEIITRSVINLNLIISQSDWEVIASSILLLGPHTHRNSGGNLYSHQTRSGEHAPEARIGKLLTLLRTLNSFSVVKPAFREATNL